MAVDVFADMNDRQRLAVAHLEGPLSVIAGAGSGKTRVITHRIAHIIQQGTRPDRILAITFTNKAAGEMQERVERLLGLKTPWITTFHSAGLRMLKLEQDKVGFAHPFTIVDDDDQKRLFRRLVKELAIDVQEHQPNHLRWQISQWKNRLLVPDKVHARDDQDVALRVYRRYVEICREECLVDFDDLLLLPVLLFRQDEEVLQRYRERFPFILIDEYQDTNPAQYALVRLLGAHGNVCATGDPDQAIYGWRGADLENILQFERDFPGCTTVLLEQNYRSTQTVLRAAQAVVENNKKRKDKTIFTDNQVGNPIVLITVDDQDDEAMAVASAVDRLQREGRSLNDIAVFYRTNAQSRTIEEWLIRRQVPYRIIGGTRFYDRREVKDLLAYCKLLINPRDSVSLMRIMNVPRRGIGETTQGQLRDLAHEAGVSLYEVLVDDHLLEQVAIGRSARPLREFSQLLRRLARLDTAQPSQCLRSILDTTALEEFHLQGDDEQGPERVANLRETVTAAEPFDGEGDGLELFLDHVSLLTSAEEGQRQGPAQVVLMTLHASKGLEFPVVFIVGCEQGVLPLVRQGQPCDYEEERRLMYVGITRTEERLYLSRAVVRTQFGRTVRNPPSMFLGEIPDDCIEHHDRSARRSQALPEGKPGPTYPKTSLAHQVTAADPALCDLDQALAAGIITRGNALRQALGADATLAGLGELSAGDRLVHETFGIGAVVALSGAGDERTVVIDFADRGQRELLLRFAAARLRRA